MSMNQLQTLQQWTKIVADSGNWMDFERFKPEEATTNPSLILKVLKTEITESLLQKTAQYHQQYPQFSPLELLIVCVGKHILEHIPGRVSTEVDVRYSWDQQATIKAAENLIRCYQNLGVDKSRVLIKIAATWEGIQAAKVLESRGIACNLTLIFNTTQAIACADANVTLISPFVGRIYDWYKKNNLLDNLDEDPGVHSVKTIYQYFKAHRFKTEIMGASFRNTQQIAALAGCDRLTISPNLLAELNESHEPLERQLRPDIPQISEHQTITREAFNESLQQDVMAHEKLDEGIASFKKDTECVEKLLADLIA